MLDKLFFRSTNLANISALLRIYAATALLKDRWSHMTTRGRFGVPIPEPIKPGDEGTGPARIALTSLEFSDGTSVPVDKNAVVVIVGPNNSGKTRALEDIYQLLRRDGATDVRGLVCTPTFQRLGDVEKLKQQLSSYRAPKGHERFVGPDFEFDARIVQSSWQANRGMGAMGAYFSVHLGTSSRLNRCGPGSSHPVGEERPRDPFQMLYENPQLEQKVSEIFREVFDCDVVLNPRSGSTIPLYVGDRPPLQHGEHPHDKTYIEKIVSLPRLEAQGDGIKSFAAIVLAVKVFPRAIILIDEPEAFLHPPQARRVGRLLAEEQPNGCQIVVATHSEDVIQGLLLGNPNRVAVIRIVRRGNVNHATQLENARVAELWKSPILRYSNVLSGLFHEGVVITESDGDCRFYEAIAQALPQPGKRRPDLFYTYSGGKDRMPVLINALRSLDVPVRVVADVDVLRDETVLERIVSSLGGNWSVIGPHWQAVCKAIESGKNWFRARDLREKVVQLLKPLPDESVVEKATLDELGRLGRQTSPWNEVKRNGLPGPLSGAQAGMAKGLLGRLAHIGLFVVPVGELECFIKTIGGHGPRWVEQALARDLAKDPELRDARDFVSNVVRSF